MEMLKGLSGLGAGSNTSKFKRLGGRGRISNRKSGKFKVWENAKGEWCLGNKCFQMKATEEGVKVRFNTQSEGCPTNMREAAEHLMDVVKAGKETTFIMPKPMPTIDEM